MASSKKNKYSEFLARRSSTVWDHFLKSDDGLTAKCQICSKKLKTTDGSTSGLHTHLRTMHSTITDVTEASRSANAPSTLVQSANDTPSTSTSVQEPTTKLKKRKLVAECDESLESVEVVVSKMAALDGISFSIFSESQDIRHLFKKSGYDLPKTPNIIAKMVYQQAEEIKHETVKAIMNMKENGERFTLTLNEWTSLRNKRYMNINLHGRAFKGLFKNLGLAKITGSMTTTAALCILRDHLEKFNINLEKDIVGLTTDSASVIREMGTYIPGYHQLCLAHGIHLAVLDTLYETTTTAKAPSLVPEPSYYSDTNSDDDNELSTECGGFEIENQTPRTADPRLYKEVIGKVRRIVRLIKKSPYKADALRAYVGKQFHENIQLQLDCRTRWSTTNDMIGSFLKIKDCIFKIIIDFKLDISFTEVEIRTLTDYHRSLEVVKINVLSLCQRDATLYTADIAMKFMLSKLDKQNTFLSSRLAANLRIRIKERRLLIAGILQYLHDSESFYNTPEDDTFSKPTSEQICEVIVSVLQRLKYKPVHDATVTKIKIELMTGVSSADEDDEPTTCELTLQQEFDKEMEKCKETKRVSHVAEDVDISVFVWAEKAIYDNKGERGVHLTQAYTYLKTIMPTSVESERAFSSAGYFGNKIRSSLSDKMLDALSFLRSHYQEK